jgi:hypothetical protein
LAGCAVIEGATALAAMVTLNALLAVSGVELESFTWIVNEKLPDWVGIPLI